MSIQSEILRIAGNVSDAFDAIEEKGVTVPSGSTSDDLADLIGQIQQGGGSGVVVVDTLDSHGGIIREITAVDLSNDTIDAAHLLSGYTAHDRFGDEVVGSYVPSGSTLQAKTNISPSTSSQTITPDSGYDGLSSVQINAMPSGTAGTPVATKGTVSSHSITVTPSVTNTTGYITGSTKTGTAVTVAASELVSGTKSITANGTGIDVTNYASVDVAVPSAAPNLQAKTNIDPSTSSQTIEPDTGYDGLSSVQINAMPSMTLPTAASSSSSGTSKATISRSTSDQYINIPTGYNSSAAYYKVNAVANGSATAPASISGTSATVSTGTNTITLTKTVSVTPTVSAGYVASGTAGNSSVSLTASVTTKAAATITPTKSTQTISSGTYLTGTQTIAAIPAAYQDVTSVTAAAGDVVSGKAIVDSSGTVVNGTLVIQHYYTGSGAPSSSTGVDGDIYLQTS